MPFNVNSLAPVVVNAGNGAVVLALETMGFSADILQNIHHHSGNVSPTLVAGAGANPRVMLTIPFLLAFNTFGLGVAKLTQCDIFFSRYIDFVRQVGTNAVHSKLGLAGSPSGNSVAAAQIVGATVNVDGIIMAVVEILPVAADYQVHPQTLTYNTSTLPTLLGSPQLHTLGPVSVMGTVYPGLESSGFQIQGNLATQRTDGDLFPRVAHRTEVAPQLTLTHRDPLAIMNLVGLVGLTIGAPGVTAYFKAYDNGNGVGSGSGLVSAANGISITVSLGRLTHSGADANQGQVLSNHLLVTGINPDGISSPLVITTGVAIPEVP